MEYFALLGLFIAIALGFVFAKTGNKAKAPPPADTPANPPRGGGELSE